VKKILCPYCFEHINLFEVHWRCSNVQCRRPGSNEAPGEVDDLLGAYLAQFRPGATSPRLPHTFPSPKPSFIEKTLGIGHLTHTSKCDWCGKPTPRRVCPQCHNELPYTADTVENHVIAVIGPREVGKSNYIAVLVDRLQKHVGTAFNLSLMALNDSTTTRYRDDFYTPLFRNHRVVQKTQIAGVIQTPLMFRLNIASSNPLIRNKVLSLIFFDTAGETFDNESLMYQTRYLANASAIILLVDPLQMEKVRVDVGARGCPLPQAFTEPAEVVTRVNNLLRQERKITGSKKINIPFAISFTKSDVLRDYGILPPGNAVYSQPLHQGQFNRLIWRQIHDEVQSVMGNWDDNSVENLLRNDCSDYSYFCLSSFGEAPDSDQSLSTISPFRVEDPLLWSLSRLGYLQAFTPKEGSQI
ncbi:MAG: hypothetical protein WCO51_13245, partial [bacterium]